MSWSGDTSLNEGAGGDALDGVWVKAPHSHAVGGMSDRQKLEYLIHCPQCSASLKNAARRLLAMADPLVVDWRSVGRCA